jgi:hypothetical protein
MNSRLELLLNDQIESLLTGSTEAGSLTRNAVPELAKPTKARSFEQDAKDV